MKVCRTCKEKKELTAYYKHPATADKRFSICKECADEVSRKRYEKAKQDPEKFKMEREKYNAQKRERNRELKRQRRI